MQLTFRPNGRVLSELQASYVLLAECVNFGGVPYVLQMAVICCSLHSPSRGNFKGLVMFSIKIS